MHSVADDTSSLICLRDTDSYLSRQSMLSDSSSILDVTFEFDRKIFDSKPYQVALRSALARTKGKMPQRQRPPLNDPISVLRYERSNSTEKDAQTVRNKSLDFRPLNDAVSVVGYKEDAQAIRSKALDSWPSNDANFNEVIKKSDQADDANVFTREQKVKMSQRPKPSLNDAINAVDYKRAKDTENDAQTVRNICMSPGSSGDARSLGDATKLENDQRSIHTGDDALAIQRSTTLGWEYLAGLREERGDENNSLTDKRRPGSITSPTKSHTATMIKKAIPKLSLPPSSPMTIGRGFKSMVMKGTNLQSSPSSIALHHLQKNTKVVLLGTVGAGKSTLWKSMTICHEGTLGSPTERARHIGLIYRHLIEDIRTIFVAMKNFKLDSAETGGDCRRILLSDELSDDVVSAMRAFWDDST